MTRTVLISTFMLLIISTGILSARSIGSVDVGTGSYTYYTGDNVTVYFQAGYSGDVFGTAEIFVSGPSTGGAEISAGTLSIETGQTYTTYVYGSAFSIPGIYTIKVVVGLTYDVWEGSTSIQVIQSVPFDFSMTITPPTITIETGETVQYDVSVTYSDPYYVGTEISPYLTGLDSSMQYTFTYSGVVIKTSDSTPPGTYVFTITGSSQGITRQATATLIVKAPTDYTVTISPINQTINLGEKGVFTIVTNLVSGNPETVSLSLSGLPSDFTYTFSPASGVPTFTSTLTIDLTTASTTGTFTIPITVTGGGLTKKESFSLTVKEKDFSLTVDTNNISVKQGDTANVTIDIKALGGFDETVTLKATNLPDNATSKFSSSPRKPPYKSTLTINLQLTTPEGNYPVTIEAEGGGLTHSETVTLQVEKKPFTLLISLNPEEGPATTDSIMLITIGQKPNIEGTLTPSYPGGKIILIYTSPHPKPLIEELLPFFTEKTGEGKIIERELIMDSDGSFSDDFSAKSSGEWTVKAVFQENGKTIAESDTIHFTIKTNPIAFIIVVVFVIGVIAAMIYKSRKGKLPSQKTTIKKVLTCPQCGQPLIPGDSFCASCGKKIE
jgi:hypothetical protein